MIARSLNFEVSQYLRISANVITVALLGPPGPEGAGRAHSAAVEGPR